MPRGWCILRTVAAGFASERVAVKCLGMGGGGGGGGSNKQYAATNTNSKYAIEGNKDQHVPSSTEHYSPPPRAPASLIPYVKAEAPHKTTTASRTASTRTILEQRWHVINRSVVSGKSNPCVPVCAEGIKGGVVCMCIQQETPRHQETVVFKTPSERWAHYMYSAWYL